MKRTILICIAILCAAPAAAQESNRQTRQRLSWALSQAINAATAQDAVIAHLRSAYDAANARVVADSLADLTPLDPPADTVAPPPPPLAAPTPVVGVESGWMNLRWGAVDGATSYRVAARQGAVILGDSVVAALGLEGPAPSFAFTACVSAIRATESGPEGCVEWSPSGAPAEPPPADTVSSPPPPTSSPPVDLPLIREFGFGSMDAPGWYVRPRDGQPTAATDATAPTSAPQVVQFNFPRGFPDGRDPGVAWTSFSASEVLARVWFRVSPDWEHHPNNFKHAFFLTPGRRIYSNFTPGGFIGMLNNNDDGVGPTPNVGSSGPASERARGQLPDAARVRPGEWQLLDMHGRMNGDGTALIQWWVDGVLIGRSEREPVGATRFTEFNIVGTWGGGGRAKSRTDWIRYDHARVYGR